MDKLFLPDCSFLSTYFSLFPQLSASVFFRGNIKPEGSPTHHFLCKFFRQELVLHALLLHLQALLVVVDCQLLQGLQDLLHLRLSRFILRLQPPQFRLHLLAVAPG